MINFLGIEAHKEHLTCDPILYRKCIIAFWFHVAYNFLFIFLLDFVSALVDLVHLIKMPKFMS
jgi:hypothetical protein